MDCSSCLYLVIDASFEDLVLDKQERDYMYELIGAENR